MAMMFDFTNRFNFFNFFQVKLVGVTFASMGMVHRISFRTQHLERVKCKRLIPGTLVVLSDDNFETMKFATVISRPLELLGKTHDLQIEVFFGPDDAEFVWPEKGYTMVESTSYFEAYRHVLKVLQELDPDSLPFKTHIVDLVTDIDEPEYLKRRHSVYDFGKAIPFENIEESFGTSKIDIRKDWPPLEQLNSTLHASQYEAMKQMLTKRFALIQGPPGTGKTYVGLAAVQILVENSSGTIMIACQTNHALD
ncbi:5395_t:CDS:2, partial [Dentiscutata erythropus]